MNKLINKSGLALISLSLIYSIVLAGIIILVSYASLRTSIKEINNKIIEKYFQDISTTIHFTNFEATIKSLQTKTELQQIAIFDNNCRLLSSSSWAMDEKFCETKKNNYLQTSVAFQGKLLKIVYKYNVDFYNVITTNVKSLLAIFCLFFICTSVSLILFMDYFFLKPIKKLSNSALELEDGNFKSEEFSIIYKKLTEFQNSTKLSEKEKTQYELTRTVVHDIRSPLGIIKSELKESQYNKNLLILKIKEIEYHIEKLINKNTNTLENINLDEVLKNLSPDAFRLFGKNIKFHTYKEINLLSLISTYDLSNIVLNLIKNSFESEALKVELICNLTDSYLEIEIIDDGRGIEEKNQELIFYKNFTTKKNGNGIGLSSIQNFLSNRNGALKLLSSNVGKTVFLIEIPILKLQDKHIIFIEDDKYIRAEWNKKAKAKNLSLTCFSNFKDFENSQHTISKQSIIFIDSDLNEEVTGEVNAKELYHRGFENIYLATSQVNFNLSKYPWIKALAPKFGIMD